MCVLSLAFFSVNHWFPKQVGSMSHHGECFSDAASDLGLKLELESDDMNSFNHQIMTIDMIHSTQT